MFLTNVFRQKSKFSSILFLKLMLFAAFFSYGAIDSPDAEKQHEKKLAFVAVGFKSIISGAYFSPAATFTVNNTGDSVDVTPGNGICADTDGNCTLRAAIQEANASPGIDLITFDLTNTPATIQLDASLSPAELTITEALTINGLGARLLTVSGNVNTTDGIFKISSTVTTQANISGITIDKSRGHGINNEGRLSLTDVSIKTNKIGINNSGRLIVNRATISSNTGSGIYLAASSSNVNISNTTITNNLSATAGGGIHSLSGDVTLNNVTISHNNSEVSGGGIFYNNAANGFYLRNTIVANNTATTGPDVLASNANGKFVSRGNNLIGKSAVNMGFTHATNNDKVGTATVGIEPNLGPLQNNGGTTDTRAISMSSPAIDAGNICVISSSCPNNSPSSVISTDQRGTDFPRIYDGNADGTAAVDIGAFEAFYPMASITSFVPNNWGTGRGAFELVINGTNFVAGSQVKWNGQNRVTTFVSNTQIKAQILAGDTTSAGQFPVTVVNPAPGGGTSEALNFPIVNCNYSINPTSQTFLAAGGSNNFAVNAVNGCAWTAVTSGEPWLSIVSGSGTGTGNGTVAYTVAPNSGAARNASISVGGQTFNINQSGGCTYSISPTSANNVAASGTTGSFTIMPSNSSCGWTAQSSASWITIANPSSGTSSGTINYTIAANAGPARSGNITVAGEVFNISQASGCSFALSSPGRDFPAAAGNGSFDVIAGNGCTWTAASSASWVKINSGATGNGNGNVVFSVEANTGPARTATITVDNRTYTINQSEGCVYTLSSTSASNVPATGTTLNVTVTASSGCAWSSSVTTTNASWITITSGASGSGNGTVSFTIAANTGLARQGTLTIAGQTFTVNQLSGCTFTLSPTNANNVPAAGVSGSFTLTTPNSGCGWTATSSSPWITVNPQNGSGPGTINYTVAANTGPARNGTITVGEATFSISQASGCSIILSASTLNVGAEASNGSLVVTAGNGCTWAATSSASWLTITSGATGSGNGSVIFTYEANTGAERTATITVDGKVFTVIQASGCVYTLSSTSASNVPATGTTLSVTVTTNTGCPWTSSVATASASWITITSGASGSGNGTVNFTIAANTGLARTGTLTIAGQTFTVSQNSGCTITLSPTTGDFDSSGGTGTFNVTTNNPGCTWTATSNVPWITINSGSPGTGNGTVTYTVQANVTPERTGKIIVGGKEFIVTQSNGCSYSLPNPPNTTIPAAGGTRSFAVNTGGGCLWTPVSNASWITITSNTNNTGSGTVNYMVAANNGPPRTGTITVGGKIYTINQETGCTFTLNPTGAPNVSAAGATLTVTVTASNSGCAWTSTVAANSPWITITGNAGATGNGSVQLTIAANTGPARTGTVTIGNQAFIVTQVNGCVYSLTPTSLNINENGGDRSFNINTGAGCTWTVASNAPWITILSGASGEGSKPIGFRVAANTGLERNGTITAGGQTFTVYQLNLIVSNLNDDGAGSLRKAIANANAAPGDDVISFQSSLIGTITLTSGEIMITSPLEIKGLGADVIKISGNNASRIFYANESNVTIRNLTLTKGNGVGRDSSNDARYGGAIYVYKGSILLDGVNIFQNAVTGSRSLGGGMYIDDGGMHRIENSTISYNSAPYGAGGLFNRGELNITNSTIAGNIGNGYGGGGIHTTGSIELHSSTITGNSTDGTDKGAGIFMEGGIMTFRNTIIAGNNGPEITIPTGSVSSAGNNLIGDAAGDSADTKTRILYQPTDILDTEPMLSVLENYGGGTFTTALLPGSPAINAGNGTNAPQTDQRGAPRIVSDVMDIGAFEQNIVVTPSNTSLPDGTMNNSYSKIIEAERIGVIFSEETFRYSTVAGYLPEGLQLDYGTGIIAGTVASEGTYTFTVRASGDDGMAGANKYTIVVGCSYTINPVDSSIGMAGGNGVINLTAPSGCAWTAASNVSWITVGNAAASGTGNGSIPFTVAANTGAARSGTITVGGKTFTINQSGGCAYSLSSSGANVPETSGTTSFTVNTGTGCAWAVTDIASWLSISGAANGSGTASITVNIAANSGAARTGTLSVAGKIFTVNQSGIGSPKASVNFDYDGDGKSDMSVFRPESGVWHLLQSQSGYAAPQFGLATDKLIPADYDGDGKTDLAVFRENPAEPGKAKFFILHSSNNQLREEQFGSSGDIPVAADWDGDGKTDVSVYRAGTQGSPQGYFYYRPSSEPAVSFISYPWGIPGDKSVVADFDGDGKADPAVFRPATGEWFVDRSRDGFYAIQFGATEDKPVVGDYDGDGKADQAVFRPSNGVWYVWNSRDGFSAAQFGVSTDLPAPADYDGDGKTDMTVYRDGTWFILNSSNGFSASGFGVSSDKPVPNSCIP